MDYLTVSVLFASGIGIALYLYHTHGQNKRKLNKIKRDQKRNERDESIQLTEENVSSNEDLVNT